MTTRTKTPQTRYVNTTTHRFMLRAGEEYWRVAKKSTTKHPSFWSQCTPAEAELCERVLSLLQRRGAKRKVKTGRRPEPRCPGMAKCQELDCATYGCVIALNHPARKP